MALALLASLGHAAADMRITSMTLSREGPIPPDTGTAVITVEFEWDCDATAQPPEALFGGKRRVDVNVTAPDGVIVTGSSSTWVQYPAPCVPARAYPDSIKLNAQVTQDVPGLIPQTIAVSLSLAPANITEDAGSDEASIDVYAQPVPRLSAQVAESVIGTRGPTDIKIDLSNLGNVPIRVDAEVVAPAGEASWTPVHLTREDRHQTGILHVVPPSGNWDEYSIQAHFTPVEPTTGTDGQGMSVNLLIHKPVGGPSGTADAPDAGVLVLLSLLAAALVARRRSMP